MRRTLVGIVVLIAAGLGAYAAMLVHDYGTVAPCGIVRERVRQHSVLAVPKFGAFNPTVMSDDVVNGLIAAKYGKLTTARCIRILIDEPASRPPA